MSDTMSAQEVAAAGLDGWEFDDEAIHKSFGTDDFATALALVNRIGEKAEEANHHPDLELGWGTVVVHLTTHSAGGVTDNDVAMARTIDGVA